MVKVQSRRDDISSITAGETGGGEPFHNSRPRRGDTTAARGYTENH